MAWDAAGPRSDVEPVPGSIPGKIYYVEQVPWPVAGATDVAVTGPVTLQGPGTWRWQGQVTLQGSRAHELAKVPGPKHYYRFRGRICDVEQVPCAPVAEFVTLNRSQDRSGAGFATWNRYHV